MAQQRQQPLLQAQHNSFRVQVGDSRRHAGYGKVCGIKLAAQVTVSQPVHWIRDPAALWMRSSFTRNHAVPSCHSC
jgi:hypothetical protein